MATGIVFAGIPAIIAISIMNGIITRPPTNPAAAPNATLFPTK
jgi:hypothetical protein